MTASGDTGDTQTGTQVLAPHTGWWILRSYVYRDGLYQVCTPDRCREPSQPQHF